MLHYDQSIQKTLNWIESHLNEPLDMEAIAKVAGFSKFHFQRIFQSSVGMSIGSYIRMRRLANSASTLIYTNERIIDIAIYYQFESQEAFTRAFKKLYHLPPGRYRKIMSPLILNEEESHMVKEMKGWFLSGSSMNYEIGVSHDVVHEGKASGYIKSINVKEIDGFGTMMQQFKAEHYIGKRIKLSCFIKTKDIKATAGLWMRVDSASEDVLQFDNMVNRPITGTTHWNHYSIVLDVPGNSATIAFGVLLTGTGTVWVDQFDFIEVDKSTPTTNLEMTPDLLDEPINLSFEEEIN